MLITVEAIATDLRLRRPFTSLPIGSGDCFPDFEMLFDVTFVSVARFNFAKKSLVINVESFNRGLYVPSSKTEQINDHSFYSNNNQ